MVMKAIPTGPPQYVETYPSVGRSVSLIRHQVTLVLKIWSMGHLEATAHMVVSELATNSIQHSGGESFVVSFLRIDDGVRISVTDCCEQVPVVCAPGAREENGRGMHIVDVVSCRWGVNTHPKGKTVWADVVTL